MKYLIANWKANMSMQGSATWVDTYLSLLIQDSKIMQALENNLISIIICPPSLFIPELYKKIINHHGISLGAQHVSSKPEGSFTGEISASMLNQYITYALVGHSERRSFMQMSEEDIKASLLQCKNSNITAIHCVRGTGDSIYDAKFIAYEPVDAIGTGNNADLSQVISTRTALNLPDGTKFIYGGSITPENTHMYMGDPAVDGVLVGAASLDPHAFYKISQMSCLQ